MPLGPDMSHCMLVGRIAGIEKRGNGDKLVTLRIRDTGTDTFGTRELKPTVYVPFSTVKFKASVQLGMWMQVTGSAFRTTNLGNFEVLAETVRTWRSVDE